MRDGEVNPGEFERADELLVRWSSIEDVAVSLASSAEGPVAHVQRTLRILLDHLTLPHRLLERLNQGTERVLGGDVLAVADFTDQLDALKPVSNHARDWARLQQSILSHSQAGNPGSAPPQSVGFDGVARLAAAAVMANPQSETDREVAVDTVVQLALMATEMDVLLHALRARGPGGLVQAVDKIWASGRWPSSNLQQVVGPQAGPFLMWGGPGGWDQLPIPEVDTVESIRKLIDDLRADRKWNVDVIDHRLPILEVFWPGELIDRDQIRWIACLLKLREALRLRGEPPPARPARVVWSDLITSVEPTFVCPGGSIVIHGGPFGRPSRDVGIVIPTTQGGCREYGVSVRAWKDSHIQIGELSADAASGPVGFVDLAYVRAYNAWAARMNALTDQIIEKAECAQTSPGVGYVRPFEECAPATRSNWIRIDRPEILAFDVNGKTIAFVEPGQGFRLRWAARGVDSVTAARVSPEGPLFPGGATTLTNPSASFVDMPAFTQSRPVDATYELSAAGRCGATSATVNVRLRKVPRLRIDHIEATQAIQLPTSPAQTPLPLVAHKDTIVRVFVTEENLGKFSVDGVPGQVPISGHLLVRGDAGAFRIPPLSAGLALSQGSWDRSQTSHSLNFRVPAAIAHGTRRFDIAVWTASEFQSVPTGASVRPQHTLSHTITWHLRAPMAIRYVRVSSRTAAAPEDAEARDALLRALDLLPTPATDVAPARLRTWHTSANLETEDGMQVLLNHLHDQHDGSVGEFLGLDGDAYSDDDNFFWIGLFTNGAGGKAKRPGKTAVAALSPKVIAHELGHNLGLRHVFRELGCPKKPHPKYGFDTVPNYGIIDMRDAFDPREGIALGVVRPHYDFMTYACHTWVTRHRWTQLFRMFPA